jgi:hypothetical protein
MPRANWEIEEHDRAHAESSSERFDRVAFAERALALLRPPPHTIVAVCEGRSRVKVASGRTWGRPGERWAMVSVPPNASRRAIALAVAEIADASTPWALDVLLGSPSPEGGE